MQQQQEPLSFEKVWKMFQETDRKFQESQQELTKRFQETDKKFQDTDKKFQETDKKVKELANLFTGQWGKLVEALMAPGCLHLFQQRGHKITQTHPNAKSVVEGRELEIDMMLVNNDELVVVEIKTTARVKHIRKLLQDMKEFKTFFPVYAEHKVYGAIAAIRYEENCNKFATDKGLFVIRSVGEGLVEITNPPDFQPTAF